MTPANNASSLAVLLRAAAGGDQGAFAEFYDLTAPRAFGLCLRVLRSRSQAEEVTQEVYLQVWRQCGSFDSDRGSAIAWLLSVAHRRSVDRVRSETARSNRQRDYESHHQQVELDHTSEEALAREEAGRIRGALANLTPRQRQAIELAYFSGLTHAEVAERLDIPLGTAKSRVRDGLSALRTVWREEHGEEEVRTDD